MGWQFVYNIPNRQAIVTVLPEPVDLKRQNVAIKSLLSKLKSDFSIALMLRLYNLIEVISLNAF